MPTVQLKKIYVNGLDKFYNTPLKYNNLEMYAVNLKKAYNLLGELKVTTVTNNYGEYVKKYIDLKSEIDIYSSHLYLIHNYFCNVYFEISSKKQSRVPDSLISQFTL